MISAHAKTILLTLQRYVNTWVDAKLLKDSLPIGEPLGPLLSQLKNNGYTIYHQQNKDPRRKSWQYKLIVADKKPISEGWICSRCGRIEDKNSVKSNTLSERHATTYCITCNKKQIFELRR